MRQSGGTSIRSILVIILVLGFIGTASVTAKTKLIRVSNGRSTLSAASEKELPPSRQETKPDLSAILFVNSMSCPCTREQCRIAEEVMEEIKTEYGNVFAFETIDYELQYEKAKPLLDKFNVFMIPVLIVLDKKSHVLWQCEDFSEGKMIRSKFEGLRRGNGAGTSAVHSQNEVGTDAD